MQRAAVLLACLASLAPGRVSCPETCDGVRCLTDVTQADCDKLTAAVSSQYYYSLQSNASYCGCCPGCYRFSIKGAACNATQRCAPGLKCSAKTSLCIVVKQSCDYERTSASVKWKPTCDPDGSFSSKQCKGEQPTGRCFCSNSTGGRIFGQEWWTKAKNMTCEVHCLAAACSRRATELRAAGRLNVTLHCDQRGNYERLQCDSGLCWCAEPNTGLPNSRVVPATLMTQLPCYNATLVGSQYLRQCESQYIAVINIREELQHHGTNMDSMAALNCDRDGSYGSVQVSSNLVYCKSRNNTILSGQGQVSSISTIDCNCARDQLYYPESGMGTLPLNCQANGNYNKLQYDNANKGFCVDSDGYIIRYLTEDDYDEADYGTALCEDD